MALNDLIFLQGGLTDAFGKLLGKMQITLFQFF